MIIFASRAHYSAIGGVENSIRSLAKVASQRQSPSMVVCREAQLDESLDVAATELPRGVGLVTYADDIDFHPLQRLWQLHHGGYTLVQLYQGLYYQHPDAHIIARHHMHVLAAHNAGFKQVCYLVPSLTAMQLKQELSGASWSDQIKLYLHMWIDGALQKRAFKRSNLFVFSKTMRDSVLKNLPKYRQSTRIKIVKPGIDCERFLPPTATEKSELRAQLGLPLDTILFLFVGRFVQAKGLDFLVPAMTRLSSRCGAILIGDGERKVAVRKIIALMDLDHRVQLVDATLRIEDYYRACDIFVMSSTYEPFGQTILEAVASGLRVVAFNRSTGVKTATHELGLDVVIDYADQLDADGLALAMDNALEQLCTDSNAPSSLDQAESQDRAINTYSWSTLLDQLLE
ncbi:glycosyltransferase [Porticoccaceae bacterium]|nr:glycosyltransferase [Porticoccaceae bacterium]